MLMWWAALTSIWLATAQQQTVFNAGASSSIGDLRAISTTEHTTLVHPSYPRHTVRIKQTTHKFCDDTVKSYTGYLDVTQARHMFFYFFESRNDPKTDDVILWTNGGPGCSSSLGLFMELGPCQIKDANGTSFNPYSWNSRANIIFIDQPAGVGFSYAQYGESIGTTEDAAKDIAVFVAIFFNAFKEFEDRRFHLAGESYGGKYLPKFAAQIYDENKQALTAGFQSINLVSIMMGNGCSAFDSMIPSYYDIQCSGASIEAFQDISTCVRMKQALPRCQRQLHDSCVNIFDALSCNAAVTACSSDLETPFYQTNKNPYDVSRDCEGDIAVTLCYPVTLDIANYLSQPHMLDLLGVDPSIKNFTACSDRVQNAFQQNMDAYAVPTTFYVAQLLERGINVLVYVGTYDWICNWVGNERWTLDLEWSGQKEFASQKLREWKVDGKTAGMTRSANGLTFATVQGAGHMVPYDKPAQAQELVRRWLAVEAL